ncbi:MAG TPA: dockerin type I domain-containing protein [Pirellulales bacterium]|jgi:hypothetical protein
MTRFISYAPFALVLSIALAWGSSAQAVSWTSSLSGTGSAAFPTDPGTGLGNWNAIYAQGFSAGTNTAIGGTPTDPGLSSGSTVYLTNFTFYRSGRVSTTDDGTGPPLPTPTNVQLALVNNFFLNTASFTTSSPELVALSTNTIASVPVSAASSGEPLSFSFNYAAMNYGPASDFNAAWDYAAIFVNVNGTTITPVRVPAIIVNYSDNPPGSMTNYLPQHDYGVHDQDYRNAVSNFINGGYLATFNNMDYADADFVASFSSTQPVHGDINGDGHFNMADITLMEQALANVSTLSNVSTTVGDFNSDGLVTNADLQGMLTALKNGQGNTSTVPEPSSIALVSVAGIALMLIGKRGGRWRA